MTEQRSLGQVIGAAILTPPRTALVLALGAAVVGTRAVRRTADLLIEEGECQLRRLNGRWERRETADADAEESRPSP